MEIINPNEIGAKISTLILNATKYFYCVTPFIQIAGWKKIVANLERTKREGATIKFYVREIKEEDHKSLDRLNIPVFIIPGLHTKLYMTEREAIVTSMNLYEYSDIYSLDLALYFNSKPDHVRLLEYFYKHIADKAEKNYPANKYISKLK